MSTTATFREILVGSPLACPAMIEEYKAPLADFPALKYPMFVPNLKKLISHTSHFMITQQACNCDVKALLPNCSVEKY